MLFEEKIFSFSITWVKKNSNKPYAEKILLKKGLWPIFDHYYQPLFNPKKYLHKSLRDDRFLPGLDYNISEQLSFLHVLNFSEELKKIPFEPSLKKEYYYENSSFKSGDAEYLYSMIRYFKPKNIIEIGSGYSTLMAIKAASLNLTENINNECKITCIEPYEQPWLEDMGVNIIRKTVESIDISFFKTLQKNDILFIDSSHIIRPQGDVLYEYLELLPTLNSGVFVHIHDIFSPKDYLNEWIFEQHVFWNEQYLLEAFLSCNTQFKITGALNFLSHQYKNEFSKVCPIFSLQENREPGSFWIRKS